MNSFVFRAENTYKIYSEKHSITLESSKQSIQRYLVQRSQAGDRQAQQELYKLYVGAMYNICRRMMGNEDDAKDALQDAFIETFSKVKTLRNPDLFPAWIKRIVVNRCISALKKKQKEQPLSDTWEVADSAEEDREAIDWNSHEAKKVRWAIDQISDGCKTVLNLYLFEGYDHKEIAAILDITESTSKAQYSKAKKKIRKILEEWSSQPNYQLG